MAMTLTRPAESASVPFGSSLDTADDMPARKRFNRAEYHLIPEEILRRNGNRCELIAGDIIEKMGQNEPHIGLLMDLLYAIGDVFGRDFVRGQMPIVISNDTELEPDISVATQTVQAYRAAGLTTPATDVRLIVEISSSTLAYDSIAKASIYARCEIPEYWVLNVAEQSFIVHRDPTPEGYAAITTFTADESVSPLEKPEAIFKVSDYLP